LIPHEIVSDLAVMALGLGGVLAGLLAQARGVSISAMSASLSVLLFGGFALLEQQAVEPFADQTWVYATLLAAWGVCELRPSSRARCRGRTTAVGGRPGHRWSTGVRGTTRQRR